MYIWKSAITPAKDDEAARLAAQIKYGLSVARWNLSDLASEQSRITYVGDGVQLWTSPEHGDAFNAGKKAYEQSLKLEGMQGKRPTDHFTDTTQKACQTGIFENLFLQIQ